MIIGFVLMLILMMLFLLRVEFRIFVSNEKWLFSDSLDIVSINNTNPYKNRFFKTIINL